MTLKVSTATGTTVYMGCSASFLGKRFYCKEILRNLRAIFLLVIFDSSCLYRLARRPHVTSRDVCYTRVNCSFHL